VRPPRKNPEDGPYAEVLEHELRARGRNPLVTNSSGWTMQVTDALRRIEPLVLHHQPRIVIISFGLFECQSLIMPTSVFRWLYQPYARGGVARKLRSRFGPRLVSAYKSAAPVLDRVPRPKRRSPTRFEQELRSLVQLIRKERGADVILLTVPPPGARIAATMPDITEGCAAYSEIIQHVAATEDEGVHAIDLEPIVRMLPLEESMPDGMHFSVEGHRLIGLQLADEIDRLLESR
jgi:GDSL-like lipase/acylhydrolase family protein